MNQKKKILFVNGHLNAGGVEKSLLDILRTLNTDKFDIELLLLEELGDYITEVPPEVNVRLVDIHNTYGSFHSSIFRCIKYQDWKSLYLRIIFLLQHFLGVRTLLFSRPLFFGSRKYDLAIGFRPGICMDLVSYAVLAPQKIGWWHHGAFELSRFQIKQFVACCKHLDKLITVSKGCKKMIVQYCPQIKDKIEVIPNMIDFDSIYRKASYFQPYIRTKNKKIFVTVGRLSKEKHIENAISAAKVLKLENKINFHWYIVGDGKEKKELELLIKSTHTQDVITLLGNKSNPYPYIKNADVLVHTSYIESQCLVVLEAMALKTLCVVTESLGVKEFIVQNHNAILVKQNVQSLIDGIHMAVFNSHTTMIEAAADSVKMYWKGTIIQQIEKLFLK